MQGQIASTTSITAIVELTAKLEAVRGETRQTATVYWRVANEAEQYNQLNNLRISRTWSATGEERRTVVAEFIRKHMHLAVSMEDIETAHTVTSVKKQGTTGATSTRPYIPPIVVRFRQRSMR